MEMATGTGKTRTAIGCFLTQLNKIKRYLVIVATPQNPLSKQWQRDIEDDLKIKFDKSLVIDGSIQSWNKKLEILLLDMNSGIYDNAIIYTIHETISNTKFIKCITKNKKDIKILFICDEVHGIGSAHQKEALLEIYDYRVGLSATPERMYDDYGTSLIRHYFGDKSFEFTIADALGTINPLTGKPFLNPYFYYPVFVNLNEKERNKYVDITKKIIYLQSQKDVSEDDINLQKIFRANILKNAAMKIPTVEKIIDKINKKSKISNTIIFATEEQVEDVLRMLSSKGISRCKITEHESYKERDNYIRQFRKQNIQVLIGLKCLDEGIDVKNARIAIIMASSTNPREYVQRIGRVIRPDKNKEYSEIYDLIVNPGEERRIDLSILQKEAHRAMQIAKNAINYDEVKNIFEKEGVYADADK